MVIARIAAQFVMESIVEISKWEQAQQDRAQQDQIDDLQNQIDLLNQAVNVTATAIPAPVMVNLLQDADINTSDLVRRGFGYAGSDTHPAFWLARDNNLTTQFTDSTNAAASPEAINEVFTTSNASISLGTPNTLTTAAAFFTAGMVGQNVFIQGAAAAGADLTTTITAFGSSASVTINTAATTAVGPSAIIAVYPTADTLWDVNAGTLMWGGDDTFVQPLGKNYCRPGFSTFLFVRAQLKYNTVFNVAPISSDHKLRISVWDNTSGIQAIIQGAEFSLTASLDSGAGAVTRHYVLQVITPAPVPDNFFYSNVASPASVGSTADPLAGSPGQVSVSWQTFPAGVAQQYNVYRSDSVRGLANYYLIGQINTGVTEFQDLGGLSIDGSNPIAITATYMKAQAIVLDIGDKILNTGWSQLTATIITPPTYNLGATAPISQYLRFDILNADGSLATVTSKAILVDFIGMAVAPGLWAPNPNDVLATGDFQSNAPDPASGGGATGGGGGGGGGEIGKGGGFLPF